MFFYKESGFEPHIKEDDITIINKKFADAMGCKQHSSIDEDKFITLDLLIKNLVTCLPNGMQTYRVRNAFKEDFINSYEWVNTDTIMYNSCIDKKHIILTVILK